MRIVLVLTSTWLSMASSLPSASFWAEPSSREARTARVFPARRGGRICGRYLAATVKTAAIGCCWVMTTSPFASPAWTMFPWSTSRSPTTPGMGAVTRQ